MSYQTEYYESAPQCRGLRDADLMLIQFAMVGWPPTAGETFAGGGARGDGCARSISLLLHRFGVFEFAGFAAAPGGDVAGYADEVERGLYPGEAGRDREGGPALPWTYTPARDPADCLALWEILLNLLVVLATELPLPPPRDRPDEVAQVKLKLRREVVHKLVTGSKSHSELSEVFDALTTRDNHILKEEGKWVNSDDAMGAMLKEVLSEVAELKASRDGANQWELRRSVWSEYDPAFYHTNLNCHQTAASKKPVSVIKGTGSSRKLGSTPTPIPYAPQPPPAHLFFSRIRRDLTSDSSVLSMVYRTLHAHCRKADKNKDMSKLRGKVSNIKSDCQLKDTFCDLLLVVSFSS